MAYNHDKWCYYKDLGTKVGAVCAMIADFPIETIREIRGWCDWLLKKMEEKNDTGSRKEIG